MEMMDAFPVQSSASTIPLGQSSSSNSRTIVQDKTKSPSKSKSLGGSGSINGAGGSTNPDQIVGVKRAAGGNGNKGGAKRGVKRL